MGQTNRCRGTGQDTVSKIQCKKTDKFKIEKFQNKKGFKIPTPSCLTKPRVPPYWGIRFIRSTASCWSLRHYMGQTNRRMGRGGSRAGWGRTKKTIYVQKTLRCAATLTLRIPHSFLPYLTQGAPVGCVQSSLLCTTCETTVLMAPGSSNTQLDLSQNGYKDVHKHPMGWSRYPKFRQPLLLQSSVLGKKTYCVQKTVK